LARLRPTLFTILTIAILAGASFPILQRQILPSAYATSVNISLVASVNGWNYSLPSGKNPTITVTDTEVVNIQLTTGDSNNHQFYVDVDRNGLADCNFNDLCSPPFNSGSPTNYGWNSGVIRPGTYNYYDAYYQAATNGTLIVQSQAPDYSLSASPSTLTILQGSSQTTAILVASKNNFTGTVSLSANPAGVGATLNPTSVSPPKNGFATSTLNVTVPGSASPGSYPVGIYATNGTMLHSFTFWVQVVASDFTMTSSTSSLSIMQGSSATATITITSQNNFSGKVSLKSQITPNGPTPSLNPTTVNVPSGGSQISTLTVSTTPTTSPGDYTITIIGNATSTSGQLLNSLAITLRVSPSTTSPGIPVVPTFLFGGVATILSVSLVILLKRRRSTRH
jgi:hypothetical protein